MHGSEPSPLYLCANPLNRIIALALNAYRNFSSLFILWASISLGNYASLLLRSLKSQLINLKIAIRIDFIPLNTVIVY